MGKYVGNIPQLPFLCILFDWIQWFLCGNLENKVLIMDMTYVVVCIHVCFATVKVYIFCDYSITSISFRLLLCHLLSHPLKFFVSYTFCCILYNLSLNSYLHFSIWPSRHLHNHIKEHLKIQKKIIYSIPVSWVHCSQVAELATNGWSWQYHTLFRCFVLADHCPAKWKRLSPMLIHVRII